MYFNNCVFSMNLGSDPEVRNVGGTNVLTFSGANSSPFGKKATTWFRVEYWGKNAETVASLLNKGTQIVAAGEVFEETWTDNKGNERKSLKFRASNIQLAGSRGESSQPSNSTSEGTIDNDDLF